MQGLFVHMHHRCIIHSERLWGRGRSSDRVKPKILPPFAARLSLQFDGGLSASIWLILLC